MATTEAANGAVNPNSPVPLDTIPISPAPNGAAPNGSNGEQPDLANENGVAEPSENEQITIFHDKDNFNVKHPLMNEWTLWFTKPPSGKACYTALGDPSTLTDLA